jgi:hypothetical protein
MGNPKFDSASLPQFGVRHKVPEVIPIGNALLSSHQCDATLLSAAHTSISVVIYAAWRSKLSQLTDGLFALLT